MAGIGSGQVSYNRKMEINTNIGGGFEFTINLHQGLQHTGNKAGS